VIKVHVAEAYEQVIAKKDGASKMAMYVRDYLLFDQLRELDPPPLIRVSRGSTRTRARRAETCRVSDNFHQESRQRRESEADGLVA